MPPGILSQKSSFMRSINQPPQIIATSKLFLFINDFDDEIILFFEPSSEISKAAAKRSDDRIAQRTTDKDVYIKQDLWQYYLKGFEDYTKDP